MKTAASSSKLNRKIASKIRVAAFVAALFTPLAAVAAPYAYPVPFLANRDNLIHFNELPSSGSIKIFTVNGERVAELTIPQGLGTTEWNARNGEGQDVASGVYLYIVDGDGQRQTGKLVVVR